MVGNIKNRGNNEGPHFLFKNFLSDKRVYRLNQIFWKKQVQKIMGAGYAAGSWINDSYANGQSFFNGNPIFSARLSPRKAIRIVQEEPESPTIEFGYWTEKTQFPGDQEVEELVISLELSSESKQLALKAIKEWLMKTERQ